MNSLVQSALGAVNVKKVGHAFNFASLTTLVFCFSCSKMYLFMQTSLSQCTVHRLIWYYDRHQIEAWVTNTVQSEFPLQSSFPLIQILDIWLHLSQEGQSQEGQSCKGRSCACRSAINLQGLFCN